ncbi:GNAT family N-acetyltransferase [Bdellovibrio sp. HCB-162]|uniref:GNAT family N-acetyltransferase n=1 Tax=Bdellovibrio sp. HCB-162 TaxID=3394234 RepID=UPI0039BCF1F4
MFSKNLKSGYVIKEVSQEELWKALDEHFEQAFSNRTDAKPQWTIDDSSKAKIKERQQSMVRYQLRFVVYSGNEVVGWHYGYSTDAETYYMQNSAVLLKYRNQGVYAELLTAVLEKLHADGFQVITSTHHPNNAAVLIPKLKKGFVISSMLLHERFRLLVELKYFFDSERRKAFDKQMGLELTP